MRADKQSNRERADDNCALPDSREKLSGYDIARFGLRLREAILNDDERGFDCQSRALSERYHPESFAKILAAIELPNVPIQSSQDEWISSYFPSNVGKTSEIPMASRTQFNNARNLMARLIRAEEWEEVGILIKDLRDENILNESEIKILLRAARH